jgi:curved DNA binding protein
MADDSSNAASDNEEQKNTEEQTTIAADLVVTKYKMASEITNRILKEVVDKCVAGASTVALCESSDTRLLEETGKVFKKEKNLRKGISFPTCISANNCICHFSPLKSDPDYIIKDGDLVKIDLGCHVDGFIAVAAHTFVVGASKDKKATGRKADVILAAYNAAEAALRLLKPGSSNYAITEAIDKIAESFKCKPVEGMLSYQLEKDIIDGNKRIIQNPTEQQKKEGCEKCEFLVHEVYALDVLVSTGEGKPKESDIRTTVYKKKDLVYQLKMKTSRAFLSEAEKKSHLMPFTLRSFEDEKKARLGVIECAKHDLMEPYPVYFEKEGEFVAEFKFTALLMPNGTMKITGIPFEIENYQTENQITDEAIKNLLALSLTKKKKKKKTGAKKTEKGAAEDAESSEDEKEKPKK